jgi:hypothetical protein
MPSLCAGGRSQKGRLAVGDFLRGELSGKISLAEAITIASQKRSPIHLGTQNHEGFGCTCGLTIRIGVWNSWAAFYAAAYKP